MLEFSVHMHLEKNGKQYTRDNRVSQGAISGDYFSLEFFCFPKFFLSPDDLRLF